MDTHGDYSSARDRSRLLGSGPSRNASDSLAPSGFSEGPGGGNAGGAHTPSVSDLAGRVSTPTALTTLASPYAPRYHLPTALPGSNFALMNSFLSAGAAAHTSEARKALVPDVQHFWSVTADSFPAHYLMTGGLYPPYPPLFPPPTESALSLLGAAGAGAGPSSSRHTTVHYQRLLEFQKEAYLVAANHHHLYGVPGVTPSAIPPYLEQTPAPAHNNPPATIGLVKQEPKELSCAEKATRLAERRNSGVKIDLEYVHTPTGRDREGEDGSIRASGRREGERPSPVPDFSIGGVRSEGIAQIRRDHKSIPSSSSLLSSLSPSSTSMTSKTNYSVADSGNTVSNNNDNNSNVKTNVITRVSNGNSRKSSHQNHASSLSSSPSSSSMSPARKTSSHSPASHLTVPANTTLFQSSTTPRKSNNNSPSRRSTKSNTNSNAELLSKRSSNKSSTSLPPSSPLPPKDSNVHSIDPSSFPPSSLSSAPSPSTPIINIPSFRTSPVPLISVQHDGVVLSALASPSSAAVMASATAHHTLAPPACGSGHSTPEIKTQGESFTNTTSTLSKSSHYTDSISLNSPDMASAYTHNHHHHHQHQHQHQQHPQRQHQNQVSIHHHQGSSQSQHPASSTVIRPKKDPEVIGRTSQVDNTPDDDEEEHIVVDSTEDARKRMELAAKLVRERAIQETIERVASAVSDDDDDEEDKKDSNAVQSSSIESMSSTPRLGLSMTSSVSLRTMASGKAYVTTSSSSFRTVSSLSGQALPPTLVSSAPGTIPVGIPVAQIRPHQFQAIKDDQRPTTHETDSSPSSLALHERDSTQSSTGIGQVPITSGTLTAGSSSSNVTDTSSQESNTVPPPNHISNPALWLQQVNSNSNNTTGTSNNNNNNNSSISRPAGSDTATTGVRYPLRAPTGFQFCHDPATGQIFLIPVPVSSEPDNNSSVPPSRDQGRKGRQSKSNAKITANQPSSDKQVPRIISTIGKDGSRQQSIRQKFSNNNNNTTSTTAISTHLTSPQSLRQPSLSSPSSTISTTPLLPHQLLLTAASILSKPTVESRGCSPINFDDPSKPADLSSLSKHYPLLSPSCKKTQTCSRAVQTCDLLLPHPVTYLKKEELPPSSPLKSIGSSNNSIHLPISSHSSSTRSTIQPLNPLSVQCPDIDTAGPISGSRQSHGVGGRREYNPFNDPQILQAADGLELLSTLAEKRPKCSSYDDPKRIFPSPSDSFKSDTPSLAAPDDTLSPSGDGEPRSGQCTPRRESRRDLSPKWSLPKKESTSSSSQFGDFKAPPVSSLELVDPVEVRERLAEVQRQYKQKQKELAKLPSRKNDPERKACKRGPGRPPKNKVPSKKSDDDSSSSSSKTKETTQAKKKRPAEELVDRVFRKLPPAKPAKVSRSIHYVKSKTGPFFKRKPAGSSSKRNRDLFGYDDKSWATMKDRKHKKKSGDGKKAKVPKSDKMLDLGNLFTNIQGTTSMEINEGENKRGRSPKGKEFTGGRDRKEGVKSVAIANIKSEPKVLQIEKSIGFMTQPQPSTSMMGSSASNITVFTAGSSNTPSSACPKTDGSSGGKSSSTTTGLGNTSNTNSTTMGSGSHFTSSSLFSSNPSIPTITFGSVHSIMESKESGPSGTGTNSSSNYYHDNCSKTTTTTTTITTATTNSCDKTPASKKDSSTKASSNVDDGAGNDGLDGVSGNMTHDITTSASTMPAAAATASTSSTSTALPSSSTSGYTPSSSAPLFCTDEGSSDDSNYGSKHKLDDDSDTDTSDTNSPNKKRKPGRPRKISSDKSTGGTETIWSKKSTCRGLLHIAEPESSGKNEEGGLKMDPTNPLMKPLFLDEEWCRRRSERIFLNEPSPQPLPSPRAEPVWKLSNFMPKNTKMSENAAGKSSGIKSDKETPSTSLSSSSSFTPINEDQTKSSVPPDTPSPTKKPKGKGKDGDGAKDKDKPKTSPTSSAGKDSTPSPTPSMKKAKRAHEHTKMKQQKAKSLLDLSEKVKKKYDLSDKVKKKYSKSSNKKDEEKTPKKATGKKRKASSSDSDNEADMKTKNRPITPEPRSAVIQQDDLKEGLNVLYLNDGLFYKGVVKAIQPPDVYGVLTAGQRGNRPHILCLEEILRDAVMDVSPVSLRYLPEGTRICAFWSQQFSCLYPGTVAKTSPNPHNPSSVNVEFDDGDSGRIPIDHVRLLPPDFPIIEYEPDPLENLPKRRKSTPDTKGADKTKSSPVKKGSTDKKKNKDDEEEDEDDDKEESEESEDSDSDDEDDDDSDSEQRMWKWVGTSTKRPGLKGRARKEFYKSIVRGKETISVGDAAVFVSTVRSNCPYIGRIDSLWETNGGSKMVKVSWFYHPEETKGGNRLAEPKNALFESPHGDDNDVQTISHRCEVLSHTAYKRRVAECTRKGQSIGPNLFYLAGFYDPTISLVKFEPNVL